MVGRRSCTACASRVADDGVAVAVVVDLETGLTDALIVVSKNCVELAGRTEGSRIGTSVTVSRAILTVAVDIHEVTR